MIVFTSNIKIKRSGGIFVEAINDEEINCSLSLSLLGTENKYDPQRERKREREE